MTSLTKVGGVLFLLSLLAAPSIWAQDPPRPSDEIISNSQITYDTNFPPLYWYPEGSFETSNSTFSRNLTPLSIHTRFEQLAVDYILGEYEPHDREFSDALRAISEYFDGDDLLDIQALSQKVVVLANRWRATPFNTTLAVITQKSAVNMKRGAPLLNEIERSWDSSLAVSRSINPLLQRPKNYFYEVRLLSGTGKVKT